MAMTGFIYISFGRTACYRKVQNRNKTYKKINIDIMLLQFYICQFFTIYLNALGVNSLQN